jgi:uncharacterized protein
VRLLKITRGSQIELGEGLHGHPVAAKLPSIMQQPGGIEQVGTVRARSEQAGRFAMQALTNPVNRTILDRLPDLALPDAWLVAGCLYQTVWNLQGGRAPRAAIKDYDVFYFDECDLSWDAEDRMIRRAARCFADLDIRVEVRNQARVHLWYAERFGSGYPALRSSRDGIDRYLVSCTCVGLAPHAGGTLELYAPYGLDELYAGVLRPNPANLRPVLYAAKAASYRARWPWLTITDGPCSPGDAGW